VEVTYEDGVLRIRAKYEEKEEEKKKRKVVYRMDRVTSFDYTTTLPRPVDEKSIEARVENGVVVVSAKIAEEAKPKKIPVKVASK
jgi:HSP20 family molecular chaperone IbpA